MMTIRDNSLDITVLADEHKLGVNLFEVNLSKIEQKEDFESLNYFLTEEIEKRLSSFLDLCLKEKQKGFILPLYKDEKAFVAVLSNIELSKIKSIVNFDFIE